LFLFKRQLIQPAVYKKSVLSYVNRRLAWKINLSIDTGEKLDKQSERDLLLDELLNGVESDYLTYVTVTYTTPLKETVMEINLRDESKYEKFLYS
jgi:hypothetical protein